ncbi:MAG: hypothetical protein NVS1B4_09960 [Gemmatimonadaceae bacterium]
MIFGTLVAPNAAMTAPHTPDQPMSDPLKPMLREVEAHLHDRLAQVCSADAVGTETTGELMRLEDALRDAARAAKDMVSIRRRLRLRQSDVVEEDHLASDVEGVPQGDSASPEWRESPLQEVGDPGAGDTEGALREVTDASGRMWRVWAVTPGQLRPRADADRLPGDYQNGWLAFETVDGEHRKRLARYPAGWWAAADADLTALLHQAVEARRPTR